MKDVVEQIASSLAIVSEGIATFLIALAMLTSLLFSVKRFAKRFDSKRNDDPSNWAVNVRLRLGRGLSVALEFLLAADILRTAVTPSWNDIGQLAAVAVLRTALNYFLEREIRVETSPPRHEVKPAS